MNWPALRPWLIMAAVLVVAYLVLRPSYTPPGTMTKKQVRATEKARDTHLKAIGPDTQRAIKADSQRATAYRAGQAAEARAKAYKAQSHAVKKTPAVPATPSELESELSAYGH